MGILRNLLEPGAIVIVLTIGTLVNLRKKINLPGPPCVETPLLEDNHEEQKPNSEDSYADRSFENRSTILSRILAHFPFLIEIWYWLLTYWIYQGLRAISARAICDNRDVFDKAERHAHQILCLEHFFHIDVEASVQKFVLNQTR